MTVSLSIINRMIFVLNAYVKSELLGYHSDTLRKSDIHVMNSSQNSSEFTAWIVNSSATHIYRVFHNFRA